VPSHFSHCASQELVVEALEGKELEFLSRLTICRQAGSIFEENIRAEVRLVGSHLRGDRRPASGQLGDLTLPARCLV